MSNSEAVKCLVGQLREAECMREIMQLMGNCSSCNLLNIVADSLCQVAIKGRSS